MPLHIICRGLARGIGSLLRCFSPLGILGCRGGIGLSSLLFGHSLFDRSLDDIGLGFHGDLLLGSRLRGGPCGFPRHDGLLSACR
ncbi:hypothetical protein Pden_1975 [Paracoccus denitrificans PD1222]|uniref:Uncharacterized protein n=1 Tax=Paracoccus denitrificans (strain Pd 1222) TaxID=318586 RepID=A1B3H3_PARDP|nr:hypothetical protein Pden_1975 [Paracoccus denitrificans PD1222]